MSITIYWRPTSDKGKFFKSGTSYALENLKQACGDTLDVSDLPLLRGMAVAARDPFYLEVAAIIEKVGEITIWGEW